VTVVGINVAAHGLDRRHRSILNRVEMIADQAAALVEHKLRERMGPVRLLVAAEASVVDCVRHAEQQVIGTRLPGRRHQKTPYGRTTLCAEGVLVVVNADAHDGEPLVELDTTVVHELVHAVQLSRCGARETAIRALRNNYREQRMDGREVWALNRQIKADEREARRLERLVLKLQ
jgi:hypothetical protein